MEENDAGDNMNLCERCELAEAKIVLGMESISMHLCSNCYNELMAEELDMKLEQLPDTFSWKDAQGMSRTFHVDRRIHPNGVYLEAAEANEFGYRFAVHGELDCDQLDLFTKLMAKTRKGLAKQHVGTNVYPNGHAYYSMIGDQIIGYIEHDETSDGTPLVIIDGKPFTWEEVGKMIMSYEGFRMKIKMYDITDDVDEESDN
ncbi:DUF7686 domain-containing protein [Neobacillus sp. Marseille-QA0830]